MKFLFTYILLIVFGWNSFQPQYHVECKPAEKKESCCSTKKQKIEEKCHNETQNSTDLCKQCVHIISVSIIYFQKNEGFFIQKPKSISVLKSKFYYQIQDLSFVAFSIWQPPKINKSKGFLI